MLSGSAILSGTLEIAPMTAGDYLAIARQPSQTVNLLGDAPTLDEAQQLAETGEAWTARDATGRLLAVMGIAETVPAITGLVWAVLAEGIGAAHLPLSRFARGRIARSALPRLEALARASDAAPSLDAALQDATAECRWPLLLGLAPVHLLRRFGPRGEAYVLFERIL